MKTSGWLLMAAVGAALVLQGCAQNVRTEAAPVTAPVASTAGQSAMAIPTDKYGKPVVRADTKENFEAIKAAILQQMRPGGRWQYVDNDERTTLNSNFADMQSLYDQFGSVDKMSQSAKVRLLADQSTVNAILTRKDGDRLICQTVLPVGSHLPIKNCKTYAQIQGEERAAQRFFRAHGATMQRKTGN